MYYPILITDDIIRAYYLQKGKAVDSQKLISESLTTSGQVVEEQWENTAAAPMDL